MMKTELEQAREDIDLAQETIRTMTADRHRYREGLKTAVTRLEGLYRLIYGHVTLGEKLTNKEEYIAERYMIDTVKLLADENGWTGRKCHGCDGTGESDSHSRRPCPDCGGTGEQNISKDA